MAKEGISNKLADVLEETSDQLLVARGKLTLGVSLFQKNSQNITALESAVNSLERYNGDRDSLKEIETNLHAELRKHLEAQARLINKLPDIQLAEDAIVILEQQEGMVSSFARLWKKGTPLEMWKVARSLRKSV